ncbi:MAG: DUF4954 family protein [Chitinophagaceae bacterium]|nr:MAG: DUF4954 family protein [Chitinophagaceae bacterium]
MNIIKRSPVNTLGYNFIAPEFLPKGKKEYYLRNQQNDNGITYRHLTAYEIEMLVRNRNTSDDWNRILVSDAFNPELVQNCKFYGLVRIGKLEPLYLEFHNLKRPVGLYNSTIISCDFGDNVVIDNVNYLSHYIVGTDVMIVNVSEIATTDKAKFGNGILKEGEDESIRIWLQVCNENGGRQIIPFDGMLPGDAYLWTRHRENTALQEKFREFTQKRFDTRRGYYGTIGDRTVIKNCRIIKDVIIGSDAYIKGANKIKNVTINSSAEAKSQIGEGCELVNGIVDYGCRIFYGVKAVRFYIASFSQLKYGARLINSYLGDNSTISCCEVLNSLIFPAHEQHHNNSFLCAALVEGQSNMAAGATVGSNHNSRSPDGELQAARGFWPGLCVSLKHNSRFASFTILAKGDYPAELDIPIPFSLVSNDLTHDRLIVMPAYWFMYNMYALARNAWKYVDRDNRIFKKQAIEFSFLAPDTVNEMLTAIELMQQLTGRAYLKTLDPDRNITDIESRAAGKKLLDENSEVVDNLEITADGFENMQRKTILVKVLPAYRIFRSLIALNAVQQINDLMDRVKIKSLTDLRSNLPSPATVVAWQNIGGQLIRKDAVEKLVNRITSGRIRGWDDVHLFYQQQAEAYAEDKLRHAISAYKIAFGVNLQKADDHAFSVLFSQSVATREWMVDEIYNSRSKDYSNRFRRMVYANEAEMNVVTGKLEDNSFIRHERTNLKAFKSAMMTRIKKLGLSGKSV